MRAIVEKELGLTDSEKSTIAYTTRLGKMYHGSSEYALTHDPVTRRIGEVQLIFTSPPFPLNTKKRYGNLSGTKYVDWLCAFGPIFRDYLTDDGSLVIELGNGWESGSPVMSTLGLEALLKIKKSSDLHLCQEFICYNPARLPTPAQWVNIERIRVKDSYTRLWWLAPKKYPKADNRRVLKGYSAAMQRLLSTGKYNAGKRPSQHAIGQTSFLTNNGGAIPPNVIFAETDHLPNLLTVANTRNTDEYHRYCKDNGLPLHPARMPDEVPEFFIRFLTEENDLVMDPFAGSNTTGAGAERLKRRWVSIEASSKYIEGSRGRFASLINDAAVRRLALGSR